jgi:hypothetical protein
MNSEQAIERVGKRLLRYYDRFGQAKTVDLQITYDKTGPDDASQSHLQKFGTMIAASPHSPKIVTPKWQKVQLFRIFYLTFHCPFTKVVLTSLRILCCNRKFVAGDRDRPNA